MVLVEQITRTLFMKVSSGMINGAVMVEQFSRMEDITLDFGRMIVKMDLVKQLRGPRKEMRNQVRHWEKKMRPK